ncbi:MAG: family 10 glycosylhydrolase [Ignavibacteria bacterium]|nr:family 10 glycosylhydrolase [Ignavibacteria bacterium]
MRTFCFWLFLFTFSINAQDNYPKREMRGTWLATVVNIDWPSSSKLSSTDQILELINIFDKLDSAGINTVFFQVRTECDALYNSNYEPWSYWLTGKQGKNPDPYFDPLETAIALAHYRGMELHAWLNPYRAVRKSGEYALSGNHISKTHPDWILSFGDLKMLNPGIPGVTGYINDIIKDIIEKYDVDGIHFDDYFYPYSPQIQNQDAVVFKQYGKNFTNIDDWRRNNINSMISKVSKTIKSHNPAIKFGVSPFGIVENKYAGTKGFESYNQIYCDPLNWIENNTVDFLTPQVYWEFGNKNAPYDKLTKWWAEVTSTVNLFIGQFSSKYSAKDYKNYKKEIPDQILFNRKIENVEGQVLFSAKSIFMNYGGLFDNLRNNLFKYPALIPVSKNAASIPPPLPPVNLRIESTNNNFNICWDNPEISSSLEIPAYYVIYGFRKNEIPSVNNPENILGIVKRMNKNCFAIKNLGIKTFIITSLDRYQKESSADAIINAE